MVGDGRVRVRAQRVEAEVRLPVPTIALAETLTLARRRPVYEALEAELAEWLRDELHSNRHVREDDIRAKALRLAATRATLGGAQEAKLSRFKCSQKWLWSFKRRNGFADGSATSSDPRGHDGPSRLVRAAESEHADSDKEEDELDDSAYEDEDD